MIAFAFALSAFRSISSNASINSSPRFAQSGRARMISEMAQMVSDRNSVALPAASTIALSVIVA